MQTVPPPCMVRALCFWSKLFHRPTALRNQQAQSQSWMKILITVCSHRCYLGNWAPGWTGEYSTSVAAPVKASALKFVALLQNLPGARGTGLLHLASSEAIMASVQSVRGGGNGMIVSCNPNICFACQSSGPPLLESWR